MLRNMRIPGWMLFPASLMFVLACSSVLGERLNTEAGLSILMIPFQMTAAGGATILILLITALICDDLRDRSYAVVGLLAGAVIYVLAVYMFWSLPRAFPSPLERIDFYLQTSVIAGVVLLGSFVLIRANREPQQNKQG